MWIAVLLISAAFASTCPSYECSTSLPKGECIVNNNSTISVEQCDYSEYCPLPILGNSNCIAYPIPKNYPGDYCDQDIDCINGNCVAKKCVGASANESCDAVWGCNPGLYCNITSSMCQPSRQQGESCTSNYDCNNEAGCNDGFCTSFFSLDNTQPVDYVYHNGFSPMCKTGYAGFDHTYLTHNCTTAPQSNSTTPMSCNIGDTCMSDTPEVTTECTCGYNSDGQAYCPLFIGDKEWQDYITYAQAALSHNGGCNTFSRWEYSCFVGRGDDALTAYWNLQIKDIDVAEGAYPLRQGKVPDCVTKTLLRDYYDALDALDDIGKAQCPMYICADVKTGWEKDQCILYNIQEIEAQQREVLFIDACPDGQTCQGTRTSNSTCTLSNPTRYANEPCDTMNACASGLTCKSGRCKGVGSGETCTSLYACDPGYYCNISTLKCTTLVKNGGACTTEYDCEINMGCDNGKCVEYFSIANNSTTMIGTQPQGFAHTCSSGYARYLETKGSFQCEDAPQSAGTPGITCDLGDQCGSNDNSGYTKPCTCGYTALGESYCPYFEGDIPLQHAISNYTTLTSSNNFNSFKGSCGTYSRFSQYCYQDENGVISYYYNYILNYLEFTDGVYLRNNPDCVKDVYEPEYWQDYDDEQDDIDDDNPHDDIDDDSNSDFAEYLLIPLILLGF